MCQSLVMSEKLTRTTASIGLIIGAILGMAGSFAPSDPVRGLLWGIDGIGLILAGSLLVVYYFRKGYDAAAAGFLIFTIGEALVLSTSGINPGADTSSFGAGTALWAASLSLISFQKIFPLLLRCFGFIASLLLMMVAIQIFSGYPVNALTKPLPFYAYPFFAGTILGWAWNLLRTSSLPPSP